SGGVLSDTNATPVSGVTLEAGGSIVLPIAGVLGGLVVESGATLSLGAAQGLALGTISGGGLVLVGSSGIESGSTILPGGGETVQSGGRASATVVSGSMTVASGGSASTTQVASGGVLTVQNGGTAFDTNATLTAGGPPSAFSGGATVIASGGQEIDSAAAAGITLQAGGRMVISPSQPGLSAVATATDIQSGGDLVVNSGGTAGVTTLNAGGTLDLLPGGGAVLVLVSGGTLIVSAGAFVAGAVVTAGGTLALASGAVGEAIAVDGGGVGDVMSGAEVNLAGASGGALGLQAGAVVSGGLVFGAPGSDIIIYGTNLPQVPISGLGPDNFLTLPDIPYDPSGAVISANSVLSLSENGQTYTFDLVSAGIGTSALRLAPAPVVGGTMIEVACYAEGTHLATPTGTAAVETLRPGDAVLALVDGAWRAQPVRWVGCTTVDLARHPRPLQAAPIRIRAHAVAPGIPRRDLLVSPDHAVFLDGALIQAQALRNGVTVLQDMPARVGYWHIELDRHALLLAEGMPAESYLDTGNRGLFAGAAGARPLHPDLAGSAARDARACAPLHLAGPAVAAAHARLLVRAVALGHRLVADPGLRILADERDVLALAAGAAWQATLPAGARTVRLRSRSFVPAWFAEDDRRRLGVAVRRVQVGGRRLPRAAFAAGWHAAEAAWRWTDGDAVLTLPPSPRPATLRLALADGGARYWHDGVGDALRQCG
nr:Hint domain-containing protein [Rhodospirillales bacterium]